MILVCIDGEPHSRAAMQWAIDLGLSAQAEVTALHVIDPYLKKFYDEIYAQGRKQYLEHVDACLQDTADQASLEYAEMCQSQDVEARIKIRRGEPLQEILRELHRTAPQMLITGGKSLNAWGRFRSRNLPLCLKKRAATPIPILSVIE